MKKRLIGRMIAPAGRGSVMVIAALLFASALLRIVTGTGSALAQDNQLPTMPESLGAQAQSGESAPEAQPTMAAPTQVAALATRDEMTGLIEALQAREAALAERERALELRQRALSVADAEITKRIEALTETEAALRATLALADEASEKDLARLTSVYENMKPKEAAALFEEMEPAFAAGFLGRMAPTVAAEVMAGLSPQVAYTISVILAGRNASVPKN